MASRLNARDFAKFGLNSYEAKSYLSLLERNSLTAPEIAKIAGIPRVKVYEILNKLVAKGFCREIPGKVKRFAAINPLALKDLFISMEREKLESTFELRQARLQAEISKKQRELDDKIRAVDFLAQKLTPIYLNSRTENDPLDYIEIIRDSTLLGKKVAELSNAAKKEVLTFAQVHPIKPSAEVALEQFKFVKKVLDRGVISKCVYEIPKDDAQKEWLGEYIEMVAEAGEQARVINEIPIKLFMADNTALIILEDPLFHVESQTTIVIEHRAVVRSYKILFDTVWNQAMDFREMI